MGKRALIIVSFGTTSQQARQAIERIETELGLRMAGYDCFRAFTSSKVLARVRQEQGLEILTPAEQMQVLWERGYTEVICQPLHILNGWEYEKMCRQIAPFAEKFETFRLGKPMLTDFSDYEDCCAMIARHTALPQPGEALVLMGHGSDHFSNAAYSQLGNVMEYQGMKSVFVGTVEGFPHLDFICKRLEQEQVKTVTLMPFLIVAGEHVQKDMAGEQEGSWKRTLEELGYSVHVCRKGLGEFPETADLFFRHLQQAQPFPYCQN